MKLSRGNVIELVNGEKYIYSNMFPDIIDFTGSKFINLYDYDNTSMKYKSSGDERDIRRIYSDYTLTTLLWERQVEVQRGLSETERTILSAVYPTYKYIARDENGDLCLFKTKPEKYGLMWKAIGNYDILYCDFSAFNHLFKSISWNDSIPRLITALLY